MGLHSRLLRKRKENPNKIIFKKEQEKKKIVKSFQIQTNQQI